MNSVPRRPWWRRLLRRREPWILLGVLAAYLAAVDLAPRMVDTDALRRDMELTATQLLGADVLIGEVEIDMRPLGGWRLRLRDVRVQNPSPDFGIDRDLLSARKVVFEGRTTDLLAGIWRPSVYAKDWDLHICRTPSERINLFELFPERTAPLRPWDPWPFRRFGEDAQPVELENGRLHLLTTRLTEEELLGRVGGLQATGRYEPSSTRRAQAPELKVELNGSLRQPAAKGEVEIALQARGLRVDTAGLHGAWRVELGLRDVPLRALTRLVGAPPAPATAQVADGTVVLTGEAGPQPGCRLRQCTLQVQQWSVPLFGIQAPVRLAWEAAEAPGVPGAGVLELAQHAGSDEAAPRARVTIRPDEEAIGLSLQADTLDLDHLPDWGGPATAWCVSETDKPFELSAEADLVRLFGIPMREAELQGTLDPARVRRLDLTGRLADGPLTFAAGDWRPGARSLPGSLVASIEDAQAVDLARACSHLVPHGVLFHPSEGRVSGLLLLQHGGGVRSGPLADRLDPVLLRDPLPDAQQQPEGREWHISGRVVQELRFDEPGDNPLLQALWRLPERAVTALEEAVGASLPHAAPLTLLRVHGGELSLGGTGRGDLMVTGAFQTRELGPVRVWTEAKEPDEAPRLVASASPFSARAAGQRGVALPDLPAPADRLARGVEAAGGLRILLPVADDALVEEAYRDALRAAGGEGSQAP